MFSFSTPASGAFAAGVKVGPLEIVRARESNEAVNIAARTAVRIHGKRGQNADDRGDLEQFDEGKGNINKYHDLVFIEIGTVTSIFAYLWIDVRL